MTEVEARKIWEATPIEWQEKFALDMVRQMLRESVLIIGTSDPRKTPSLDGAFETVIFHDTDGELAKMNLRADLLDRFSDDPGHWRQEILLTSEAMRGFANELDHMLEKIDETEA